MIDYPAQPVCMRCGCEITDEEAELCEDCTRHTRTYIQGFPAMKYQYPLDESLARFKYHNQRDYAAFYAGQIVKRHGLTLQSLGIDALIPIPIHKRKLEKRGYNQAELLALEIGKQLGIRVENNWLIRTKNTVPQKLLNGQERRNNLKKAFIIGRNDVKLYDRIILVDDIYTTGTTLDEIAALLKENGVSKVYCVTLACGSGV